MMLDLCSLGVYMTFEKPPKHDDFSLTMFFYLHDFDFIFSSDQVLVGDVVFGTCE